VSPETKMNNFPLNLLTFPFWWYAVGLPLVWSWTKRQFVFGLHKTGLLVFVRHLKEPLYGDYTKAGIFLSFPLRMILLSYKLIALLIRLLVVALLDALFILILPGVIVLIILQLLALKQ